MYKRVLVFILLCMPVYGDTVLNIYFCGTAMTSEWSDPNVSSFVSPELIAELYKYDQGDPNLSNPDSTHYKAIIDGIGTGSDYSIIDLYGQGFPDTEKMRGWNQCLREADEGIGMVLEGYDVDIENLKLNLVGFSRGGILCMMLAKIIDRSCVMGKPSVNMLVFDPVPGINPLQRPEGTITALRGSDVLPESVGVYVGVYASDERSFQFEPLVPEVHPASKKWLIRLRGAHETIVGNIQEDGHSISSFPPDYNITSFRKGEEFEDELKAIGLISKAIAQELLCSAKWGSNSFSDDGVWFNGSDDKQALFNEAIERMKAYPEERYTKMQKTVVAIGWSSYNSFHYKATREYVSEPFGLRSGKHGRFCYKGSKRSVLGFKLPALPANHNQVFELEDEVDLIDTDTAWEKIQWLGKCDRDQHKNQRI